MEAAWKVNLRGADLEAGKSHRDCCTASAFQQALVGVTYAIRALAKDTRGKVHNWVIEKSKVRGATEERTDLLSQLWLSAFSKPCFQILAKQDEKVYSKLPTEKDKNLHIAKLKIKIDVIPNA